jgi:plastocyanin
LLHRSGAVIGHLAADGVKGLQMRITSLPRVRRFPIRYTARGVAALILGTVLSAATACGSSGSPQAGSAYKQATSSSQQGSAPASAAPADTAAPGISISNFKYTVAGPVPPGAAITISNSDSMEHTVTADSANAFNVEISDNGKTTFTAPTQPGSYPFHCTYHPQMHGVLVVQ